MSDSQPLLQRLLNTPDIARIVPQLRPDILQRVIARCGLEDSAALVASTTPEQLTRVLDIDLWRVAARGDQEVFDTDRFALWIEVLMQAGAAAAAEKLIGLDIALAIAGLSRLAATFDHAAAAPYTTLDGEEMPGRAPHGGLVAHVGGYVIEARGQTGWDAIVELLMFLAVEHPDYFHRLMRGCVRLSSGPREADGFHDLLSDRDQDMLDLASGRDVRREQQGYVTPAQGRAFLQAARALDRDRDPPPPSPLARAYFRELEVAPPAAPEASHPQARRLPPSPDAAAPDVDPAAIAAVIDVLRDAGVLPAPPRALLEAPQGPESRLAQLEAYAESHAESAEQLAYLANALVAGCPIQDRAFTPQEASDAAVATCNLGLERWPPHWLAGDLIAAFQVGWTTLHQEVALDVARRLIVIVKAVRSRDREVQARLRALARELTRSVRDGEPWRARPALEVLVMLDAPSWAGLMALIDECPVIHAAVAPRRSRQTIKADDFEFVSQSSQLDVLGPFMMALPAALAE